MTFFISSLGFVFKVVWLQFRGSVTRTLIGLGSGLLVGSVSTVLPSLQFWYFGILVLD
ncbi:hypothetical protein AAFX60_017245 [Aliivibrio fischeri]